MVPHLSLFLLSFGLTFGMVFLKSFQVKNMMGNQYLIMFFTALVLGAFDILAPQIAVKGGYWLMLSGALGSGIAIVIACKFHTQLFKPKSKLLSVPLSPRKFKRLK